MKPEQEPIATLQFSWVTESSEKRETPSTGFDIINDAFLRGEGAPSGALLFFKSLTDLKAKTEEVRSEITVLQAKLAGVEAGTGHVVVFGIYLISATFLGIIFATLLEISKDDGMIERLMAVSALVERGWPGLLTLGLALVGLTTLVTKMIKGLRNRIAPTNSSRIANL